MIVKYLFHFPFGDYRFATQNINQPGIGNWENKVDEVSASLSRAFGANKSFEQSGYEIEISDKTRELREKIAATNIYKSLVESFDIHDNLIYSGYIEKLLPTEDTLRFSIGDKFSGLKQQIAPEITREFYENAVPESLGYLLPAIYGQVSSPFGAVKVVPVNKNNLYGLASNHCKAITGVFDAEKNEIPSSDWFLYNSVDGSKRAYLKYTGSDPKDYYFVNVAGKPDEGGSLIEEPAAVFEDVFLDFSDMLTDAANIDAIQATMQKRGYRFSGVIVGTVADFLRDFCISFDTDYLVRNGNEVILSMLDLTDLQPVKRFTEKQIVSFELVEDPDAIQNCIQYCYRFDFARATYEMKPVHRNQASIDSHGEYYDRDDALELPFVADADTAFDVVLRESQKLKGPVKTAEIEFPIREFQGLDLGDLIAVAHPGAISPGERLYQVRRIDRYDIAADKVAVTCIDRTTRFGEFFKLGDRDTLPTSWTEANEEQREYGCLCDRDTGKFSDGTPGKALC